MKKILLICTLLTIVFGSTSFAATIDFEIGTHKQAIPFDAFIDQGALIYGGSIFVAGQTGWDLANSGSRGMYPTALASTLDGTDATDIAVAHGIGSSSIGEFVADVQFVIPGTSINTTVDYFSTWIGFDPSAPAVELNRIVIEAFDSQDNRIVDFTSATLIGISKEFHEFSAPGISRLRLTNVGNVGFDDLTFSAVPLPAAFYLFSSGLLGLIGISRRKKKWQ